MSAKNLDKHNRWRNKTVAFRVSPEEDAQIETAVKLTGLTKQDYIIRRLLCRDVVVQGNPRVYKALRDQLATVLDELRRIEAGQGVRHQEGLADFRRSGKDVRSCIEQVLNHRGLTLEHIVHQLVQGYSMEVSRVAHAAHLPVKFLQISFRGIAFLSGSGIVNLEF